MDKWEYLTEVLDADADGKGIKESLAKIYPNWKPPKYAPEALIPALNKRGLDGWELVSLQSVYLGTNWDVAHGSVNTMAWSNRYVVTFKRRLSI